MSLGNLVWRDNGIGGGTPNDGRKNSGELGIPDITVELLNSGGTVIATTETDTNGVYLFTGLIPGTYSVRIPQDEFIDGSTLGGELAGHLSTTDPGTPPTANNPDTDEDDDNADENGEDDANPATGGGISSLEVILELGNEPTNATGDTETGTNGDADANSNLTLDFGFLEYDLGDVPDSYGTLIASDGARHAIDRDNSGNPITYLGSDVDAEFDGQPSASAGLSTLVSEGDDRGDGNDDEDGVEFVTAITPNEVFTIEVTAHTDGTPGYLNAWIDWNGDGDFADANEHLEISGATEHTLSDGFNSLAFDAVNFDIDDVTTLYSRFRFTPDPGTATSPTTAATDTPPLGEVEDYAMMSLGDLVWRDTGNGTPGTENNGIFDAGENGISGVTVELYRETSSNVFSLWGETETDSDGRYLFSGLEPGNYQVRIPNSEFQSGGDLENLLSSEDPDTGAIDPDNNVNDNVGDENGVDDPDPESNGISSLTVTLAYDDEPSSSGGNDDGDDDANSNRTVDFGFYEPVAIGNYVWIDNGAGNGMPNDGILNGSEPPVDNGVEVWLYRDTNGNNIVEPEGLGDGAPFLTTTTNGGQYWFDRLPPDQYIVHIPAAEFQASGLLNGYVTTTDIAAKDENTDHYDAGDPTIGDENGLDPATMALLATDGISSNQFNLQSGSLPTAEVSQADYPGALPDNQVNGTADFAFYRPVAIGNFIWIDDGGAHDGDFDGTPNDGIFQSGSETWVPDGVRVELYVDTNNNGIAEPGAGDLLYDFTATSSGQYLFDNLPPDQYFIHIPATEFGGGGTLENYVSSDGPDPAAPLDETADQDADENGDDNESDGVSTKVYDLQPGTEPTDDDDTGYPAGSLPDDSVNMTADLAFYQPVAIGNQIWLDNGDGTPGSGTANNGILDAGENGVGAGVEVRLYRNGVDVVGVNSPFRTVNTDANGRYVFNMLPPDQYFVYIPGSEFDTGGDLEGYISSTDSTPPTSNELTDENVDENGIDETDLVNNGIRTMVYDLRPGTEPTADDDTGYPGSFTPSDTLPDASVNLTADFGFVNRVALGNLLWIDNGAGSGGIPNNGIRDGSEAVVPDGVEVHLYASGVPVGGGTARTTTTTGGQYIFDDLPPGDYYVHIPNTQFQPGAPLDGYHASRVTGNMETDDENADQNGIDVDDPAGDGISSMVYTLTAGTEPENEYSQNGSGTPAGSYDGYSGSLTDESVNMTADFSFLIYDFGDLPDSGSGSVGAGDYETLLGNGARHVIDVDPLTNAGTYLGDGVDADLDGQTSLSAGLATVADGDDQLDGNDDEDGIRFLTPIVPGQRFTIEARIGASGTGGYLYAWIDFDGDGTLTPVTFEQTNQLSGNATVELTAVAPGVAGDPNTFAEAMYSRFRLTSEEWTNPQATGEAFEGGVSLPGEVEDYVLLSLGNLVWRDDGTGGGTPNDGIRHPGEPGIPNVWLELQDASGNPILDADDQPIRTQTDAQGNYRFTGLTPSDYPSLLRDYVVYVLPENFDSGTAGQYDNNEPLFGALSTTSNGGSNDDDDDDQDENGLDDLTPAANGIFSPSFTLTIGDEPANNGLSNPTVDFGFVQYDFGDLPDVYGTTLSLTPPPNGARHVIDRVTYLGNGVDAEFNGVPTTTALGDDAANTNSPVAITDDEGRRNLPDADHAEYAISDSSAGRESRQRRVERVD